MKTNNINIGFESLKDKSVKEVNEIENQLINLNKVKLKSKDKQFILDSYQYEEILNEELRQIKEKGINNNRIVRNTTQADKEFFKSLGVDYYE